MSELAKRLDGNSEAIVLVGIMTKDYEVKCFVGAKALDVMKRTVAPEKMDLRRCEGFAMPGVWCPVPAAIGEAVTSCLSDIAQKFTELGAIDAE